jgi:hypothetical protein
MIMEDMGSVYAIQLSADDVNAWAERWPCFGSAYRSLLLQYDSRNGDLVSIEGDADLDGAGVAALSNDCAFMGAERFGLDTVTEMRRPYADAGAVALLRARPAHG